MDIPQTSFIHLFGVLSTSATLKLIDLTGNSLGFESMRALGNLVRISKKLKFLILATHKRSKEDKKKGDETAKTMTKLHTQQT